MCEKETYNYNIYEVGEIIKKVLYTNYYGK